MAKEITADYVFNHLMSKWRGVNNLAPGDDGPFTRAGLARQQSGPFTFEAKRQAFYKDCGYPEVMTGSDYRKLYRRNGLFRRCNDAWPDECFATIPIIYETPDDKNTRFESSLKRLLKKVYLPARWHQLDKCAGIDTFGGLLLGMDGKIESDARQDETRELLWATAYSSDVLQVKTSVTDDGDRFGMPETYNLTAELPTVKSIKLEGIHWSRVVHYADPDYCESGFLYACPRGDSILNYVLDATKVGGSSAEMFYKGGFQGWAYQAYKEVTGEGDLDIDSIKENITAYQEGMQRFLAVIGGEIKSLAPNIADPTPAFTLQVTLICMTIRMPLRIFMGTEASHQASSQDTGNANKRTRRRQELVVTPYVIRPTIDRLIECGCLAAPASGDYIVEWSDLNTVSQLDQANIGLKVTQALTQFVTGKVYKFMSFKKFLTLVVGMTDANAKAVVDEMGGDEGLKKAMDELMKLDAPPPAGPDGLGRSSGANRSRPPNTTPRG